MVTVPSGAREPAAAAGDPATTTAVVSTVAIANFAIRWAVLRFIHGPRRRRQRITPPGGAGHYPAQPIPNRLSKRPARRPQPIRPRMLFTARQFSPLTMWQPSVR